MCGIKSHCRVNSKMGFMLTTPYRKIYTLQSHSDVIYRAVTIYILAWVSDIEIINFSYFFIKLNITG